MATRKRARLDDPEEVPGSHPENESSDLSDVSIACDAVRDADHYLEDGDCIIRVEDTLFKVGSST